MNWRDFAIGFLLLCLIAGFLLTAPARRESDFAATVKRTLKAKGYKNIEASFDGHHVYLWGDARQQATRDRIETLVSEITGTEAISNFTGKEIDLQDARAEAADLAVRLDQSQALQRETASDLANTESLLAEARRVIAARDREYAEYKKNAEAEQKRAASKLDSEMAAHSATKSQLSETEALVAQVRGTLEEREKMYRDKRISLETALATANKDLTETKRTVMESEKRRRELEAAKAELDSTLGSTRERVTVLETLNNDTQILLTEARRVLAQRDRDYTAQRKQLADASSAVAKLREQLESTTAELHQ